MEIIVTIAVFGTMMFIMALGVMFTGRPLKGSCGGVGGNCPCDEAGTPGACKVDLETTNQAPQGSLGLTGETKDGIKLYGTEQS